MSINFDVLFLDTLPVGLHCPLMGYRSDFNLSVYFVADPSACSGRPLVDVVTQAVQGGVSMVQLRNKDGSTSEVEKQAIELQTVLQSYGVPFIINDHVELALKIGADGVHVGQDDMNTEQARELIGEDMLLGQTAFTEDHFTRINPAIVDYVGTGPFYATKTKPDKEVLGEEKFKALVSQSPVPVVGIGGITPDNAGSVIRSGVAGVAMMRSISEADDPYAAARSFHMNIMIERMNSGMYA